MCRLSMSRTQEDGFNRKRKIDTVMAISDFIFFGKRKTESFLNHGLSQSELIEQIHSEFDTAPERLLMEAEILLRNAGEVSAEAKRKADRLEAIGFNSSFEATEVREKQAKHDEAVRAAEIVKYYRHTYPFTKFLTQEELDRICGKYGLVYAPVSRYIREVPEKNLSEIERAQPLKALDLPDDVCTRSFMATLSSPISVSGVLKRLKRNNCPEFKGETEKELFEYLGRYSFYFDREYNTDYVTRSYREHLSVNRDDKFFIAAPKDHFDLTGYEQNGKFEFVKSIVKEDPIVFRKVRGGILVITKWGIEASDEALINPINN